MLDEDLYGKAKVHVVQSNSASVAGIQREFRLQYSVAEKIILRMESEGLVSPKPLDGVRHVIDPITTLPLTYALIDTLPIHTLIFNENRYGGLLLCGINHGFSKQDEFLDAAGIDRSDSHKSFFSDKSVNDYRMRNRIVEWFRIWGFPLEASKEAAGSFEKSIVQTNWLQTVTNNVKDLNVRTACIADAESFLLTCSVLRPKVIIFFSKELLWAFTSQELSAKVAEVFGAPIGDTEWIQETVIENGKALKAFKVGIKKYKNLTAISLPHPTGSQGLSDRYIAAIKPSVEPVISAWWRRHSKLCDLMKRINSGSV